MQQNHNYKVQECLQRMIMRLTSQIMEHRAALERCTTGIRDLNQKRSLTPLAIKRDSTVSIRRFRLAGLLRQRKILSRQLKFLKGRQNLPSA